MPDVPRQELWVALAGPAVNIVLALLCVLISIIAFGHPPTLAFGGRGVHALDRFMSVNLSLAAFNMLPAFPMDGGRALRALLAERLDYVRATDLAATLGQGLALLFGLAGLFGSPVLVFIALFVWMGASAEASSVGIRAALAGIPVSRAMITDFTTLDGSQTLHDAANLVIAGSQRDFPVLEEGRLAGILTRDALIGGLAERGLGTPVRDVMDPHFETADAREMLEAAFVRLQGCKCPVLPVVVGRQVIGLLTAENVGEFVMIRGALRPKR
jgi:CBS domain-containing protein